ncbi:MAG: response regulator [Microbacterium sp.]|uniref:response regulator transcription factor n=1 Tax=Microbacterium sp. TaxID=51671 RepID=UPI0039E4F742
MTMPRADRAEPRVLEDAPVVHIVDDDENVRASLAFLLQSVGLVTLTYPGAVAFLDEVDLDEPAVVILETRMRGMSGLRVQERLARAGCPAPVVFCSAHADVPMAVRAMRAGAVDFFEKPYDSQRMLEVVQAQVVEAERAYAERTARRRLEHALAALTPRERDVLRLVVDGLPSQRIASELGTSVKTIDVHRAHIRAKTDAPTLGSLVRDVLRHRVEL